MNKPRKSRKPKPPTGCQVVWRKSGWRFRACPRISGKKVFGPWRETKDVAAQDYLDIRERGAQLAKSSELLTVEEALRMFIERAKDRGFRPGVRQPCRPETVRHYQAICRTLYRLVGGETLLHEIGPAEISDYLKTRATEERKTCKCTARGVPCPHTPRKPSGVRLNKERLVWGLVFRTAIDAGKLPGPNPVDTVDRFGEKTEEARFYTAAQVGEILASIRSRSDCRTAEDFHDVVLALFLCGTRIGEFGHIQRKNIDFKRGTLKIPDGKSGPRTIPLCAPHLQVLGRMTKGLAKDDYLLPGYDHERRVSNVKGNAFGRWRERIPEELREGFHAHTLRHSHLSHLLESGVPVHHAKAILGHSKSNDITLRYAHATPLQLRQSMQRAFGDIHRILGIADETADAIAE